MSSSLENRRELLLRALTDQGLELSSLESEVELPGGLLVDWLACTASVPAQAVVIVERLPVGREPLPTLLDLLMAARRESQLLATAVGADPTLAPRVIVLLSAPGPRLLEGLAVLPVETFEWRRLRRSEGEDVSVLVPLAVQAAGSPALSPASHGESSVPSSGSLASSQSPGPPEGQAGGEAPGFLWKVERELRAAISTWLRRASRIDPELAPRVEGREVAGRLNGKLLYRLSGQGGGVDLHVDDELHHLAISDAGTNRIVERLEAAMGLLLSRYLRESEAADPDSSDLPELSVLVELDELEDVASVARDPRAGTEAGPRTAPAATGGARGLRAVELRPGEGPILTPEEYDALRG